MMLMQKKFSLVTLLALALLQGCSGNSAGDIESTANLDSSSLRSGTTIIAQAVSATGEFIIPTDVITPDPVVIAPDPVVIVPDPVVIEPDPVVIEPDPVVIEADPVVIEADPVVIEADPVVITPNPVCRNDDEDSDDEDDEDDDDRNHHDNGKHLGFLKNAKHYGYGKHNSSKDDRDEKRGEHKDKLCVKKEDDSKKYCDSKFIKKYYKKGYKDYKFKIVNSDDLKIQNYKGNFIVVGTSQHSFVRSIKNCHGKIIICGVKVHEIKNTSGHIGLHQSEVEDLKEHKGHLDIDDHSRVKRINESQCSVRKSS